MNILLILTSYFPYNGGVETCVQKLSERFNKKGHKVQIASCKVGDGRKNNDLRIKGISIKPLSLFSNFFLASDSAILKWLIYLKRLKDIIVAPYFTFRLWNILKRGDIQIVNIHYTNPFIGAVLWIIYPFCSFKLLVTLHGFTTQQFPYCHRPEKWLFKRLLMNADYVISPSQSLLDDTVKCCTAILDKSAVISNGVDLDEFRIQESYKMRDPYILCVGNFYSNVIKGQDLLIKAFKIVVDRGYNNIKLVFVGDGQDRDDCKLLSRILYLEKRMYFFNRTSREEVIRFFKGCEFFVLPSRIEPFGIVNLEAMAAGKAIVATKVDGVPEIVKDGENGILVEPTADALAEGIMRLLREEGLRKKLGENGRKTAKTNRFNWDRITDEYLKVYGNVLKSGFDL